MLQCRVNQCFSDAGREVRVSHLALATSHLTPHIPHFTHTSSHLILHDFIPDIAHHTLHTSDFTLYTSQLTSPTHTSPFSSRVSHLTPHSLTPHTSSLTPDTSHLSSHTSDLTAHSTFHTLHFNLESPPAYLNRAFLLLQGFTSLT